MIYKKYICVIFILSSFVIAQDPPDEFSWEQSTLQAFYFFNEVLIDGNQIDSEDWVGAFKGNICVGSRQWDTSACGGGICDVPMQGDDGSEYADGYMVPGDIPTFKIYDVSENTYYDAVSNLSVCGWSNFGSPCL